MQMNFDYGINIAINHDRTAFWQSAGESLPQRRKQPSRPSLMVVTSGYFAIGSIFGPPLPSLGA